MFLVRICDAIAANSWVKPGTSLGGGVHEPGRSFGGERLSHAPAWGGGRLSYDFQSSGKKYFFTRNLQKIVLHPLKNVEVTS